MQQVQQDVDVILIPEIVSFYLSRGGIPLDEACPWPVTALYLLRAAAGRFYGHIIPSDRLKCQRACQGEARDETPAGASANTPGLWLSWAEQFPLWCLPELESIPRIVFP